MATAPVQVGAPVWDVHITGEEGVYTVHATLATNPSVHHRTNGFQFSCFVEAAALAKAIASVRRGG